MMEQGSQITLKTKLVKKESKEIKYPEGVDEPLYPYHPEDTQTSTHGPAPGLVPGGPNHAYGGLYEIPNRYYPAYAYRDWSVGCDWNGSTCASASWEITEPMAAYQGPAVLLASFMMAAE